jgi:hypothetical protein
MKVSANNPRQKMTHGYHSFESYRDGMTYSDYRNQPYDATLPIKRGKTHHTYTGPNSRHFRWDLARGFIRMVPRI